MAPIHPDVRRLMAVTATLLALLFLGIAAVLYSRM
jgi:hypothetical protein